jgi:chemotaxis family two-component system response regulator PixH
MTTRPEAAARIIGYISASWRVLSARSLLGLLVLHWSVTWPLRARSAQPLSRSGVSMEKTIVLADADTRHRLALRRGFEAMGYPVVEAADGASAMRVTRSREVGLVVTDLYMAAEGEPCLVRSLRRAAGLRRVKVLVLTDHSSDRDRDWAVTEGADAYLVKSTRLGRVLQVAGGLARSRNAPRRARSRAD